MIEYFISGIFQGIFEWLPVSSEGITILTLNFLRLKTIDILDLSLFLHLGTLLASLFYFKKDWQEIILLKNKRLFNFLLKSTFVSLIVGYPLYKLIKSFILGKIFLLIIGIFLIITAFLNKSKTRKKISEKILPFFAGFFQGLSVIPGLSRSASTFFALSFSDFSLPEILKISYLMSAPVILAACFYILIQSHLFFNLSVFLSLIFSFLVGLATLDFLMKMSRKINFFYFCLFFGLLSILGFFLS